MENRALSSTPDLQPPPKRLGTTFETKVLEHPVNLFRNHRINRTPLEFNLAPYRFNAPQREYSICYCGLSEECAFVETFLHEGLGEGILTDEYLLNYSLALISITQPLKLIDITEHRALFIGTDTRLSSERNYAITQQWALSIYNDENKFDGIFYSASRNSSLNSVAIFDRAKDKIALVSTNGWLSDIYQLICAQIFEKYKLELIDSSALTSLEY